MNKNKLRFKKIIFTAFLFYNTAALFAFQTTDFVIDVFFAQNHVQKSNDPMLKIVSDKKLLIKVQVSSNIIKNSPNVNVEMSLNGKKNTLQLSGPATLPNALNLNQGVVVHQFSDSFTTLIPAEWVKPGLSMTLNVGTQKVVFSTLNIGAPNKIVMNMFDVHFFGLASGSFPSGWKEELEEKLPISGIELNRLTNIIFKELSMQPRGGAKAVRVTSMDDYKTLTGINYDGEQDIATYWINALKLAAGKNNGNLSLFYLNIYGVPSGGQASSSNFSGVGTGSNVGILHHELGHVFSLPHWGDSSSYPYKGPMFSIDPQSTSYKETHVGPTWGYDASKNLFIPPTVQTNSIGGEKGKYKADPMQGGGSGDQEKGFILRHFSDFSVNQMKNFIEGKLVVWNESLSNYAGWNATNKTYSNVKSNNGIQYPTQRNVQVISILASICSTEPQANIVYPPVGPYKSGLIRLFDPSQSTDRSGAVSLSFCPSGGCDASVRVTQNNIEKIYMMPQSVDSSKLPTDVASFTTSAINLDASLGSVTKIELLETPNAQINGVPSNPKVLYTFSNPTLDTNNIEQLNFQFFYNTENSSLNIIGLKEGQFSATIFDISGKKIMETNFTSNQNNELLIPILTEQLYLLRISDGTNSTTKKILLR